MTDSTDHDMHDLNPGTDSPEEFQELATLIAEALAKGESREKVIADLVNNSWEPEAAEELVGSVENAMARHRQSAGHSSGSGEGMGWLVWIGAILFINFLSWAFDWGFWLY